MYASYKRTQGQITSKISTLKVDLNARRLLHFSQETYMKIYDKLKKNTTCTENTMYKIRY